MRTKHLFTLTTIIGAAALLVGCASGAGDQTTSPALTIEPEASASAPADAGSNQPSESPSGAGDAQSTLPAAIVSIDFELDETPDNVGDDEERTTTDPGHIAALTELLERHSIVSDYERDDDCDDEDWELDVDAHLEGGGEIEIEIDTCSPNAFEAELIELVRSWI